MMYYSNSPENQELSSFYHSEPIQINNASFDDQIYFQNSNSLPSSELFPTSMHNNDLVSFSPESSSSAETNLVSPPQQYYHSLEYTDISPKNNHALKRSNSVPPQFHRTTVRHQVKPLPIQIQKLSKESLSKPSQKQPVDPETYRRQLDEKLAKINFDDITVAELKETLRERRLPATGRKAELMNRLKEEYDLVINQNNTHVILNRCIADLSISMDRKKSPKLGSSPKLGYSPYYYTPPLRHTSTLPGALQASSVPDQFQFMNDPSVHFKPSCLRESIEDNVYLKEEEMDDSQSTTKDIMSQDFVNTTTVQPNVQYSPVMMEENIDVWDDQMLQNFLNQI